MIDLQFEQPQWAHLVWLIMGFTVLLLFLEHRGSHQLSRLLSSVMQERLVARQARWRRVARACCIGASCVCMVIALMRPQWGFEYIESPRVGAEIMICLDVSRSMLAEDVAPNRLERAKAEINDLLGLLDKDHVGLIAFAGKATVLCPMTPDFGFLRMVLQHAGPNSVARGGTNLETPIRKALEGYRGQSEASRAIILITDGEDHDSFVMDAAKQAAERGIRIITIGFGDENGSEINITDPKTQARTVLRDSDGKPVITRLDSKTLREISQTTESVYIPAGTGMLDLKSIYDAHIAPLTRGQLEGGGRTIKKDGYQWAILLGLAFLLAGLTVTGGRPRVNVSPSALSAAMMLLLASIAYADNTAAVTPRQIYNNGATHLSADQLDDAQQQLTEARNSSGVDSLMRYRATFNLAWIEIKRADQLLEEKPQEAITHLHAAADWFRDAIRLKPNDKTPRENLEIVTRRALALADSLAGKDERKLAARLDELIDKQRQVAGMLQGSVERGTGNDLATDESMRSEFRALEVEQRRVLTTLDEVAAMSRQEAEQLQNVEEDKRTAKQKMRQVQLMGVQAYMQQAQQRLGQTRREIRRRQAQRAYRRASTGLGELKRARDQLRNLVEMLSAVIGDAKPLAKQTAGFAAKGQSVTGETSLPLWLTRDYIEDTLNQISSRTVELEARIKAGLAGAGEARQKEQKPETQKLLATLGKAEPLIGAAIASFKQATEALTSQRDTDSYQAQARGIKALIKVRELFLDIKGLIEVMYADQKVMQYLIADNLMSVDEYLPMIRQKQSGNIVRSRALGEMIREQLQALPTPKDQDDAAGKPSDEKVQQRMQLSLATRLLEQLRSSFVDISTQIDQWDDSSDTLAFKGNVDQSIAQLEALRRLFYSIIEHLRETAKRQIELADKTRDVATLTEADKIAQAVGPLGAKQLELSQISQQIADALIAQSQQSTPGAPGATSQPSVQQTNQDQARKLAEAGDLVGQAKNEMDQAAEKLNTTSADATVAHGHQETAAHHLLEALKLLSPPKQQPQMGQDEHDQQQSEEGEKQDEKDQQQQAQKMDASRMLQAIRDREAQRHKDRNKRRSGYVPVEKDW